MTTPRREFVRHAALIGSAAVTVPLEALWRPAIDAAPRADLRLGQHAGVTRGIHWVDIAQPDKAHVDAGKFEGGGVFSHGLEGGGAIFGRLEGAWYSAGRVFVTSTDGGGAKMGQVWELDIRNQSIRLIYDRLARRLAHSARPGHQNAR